jgi:hypothetical protein
MRTFHSPRSPLTPEVTLDPARGSLRISGECYPEDPGVFFGPLLASLWPAPAGARPARLETTLRLSYVNSASTMWLRRLLSVLDTLAAEGTAVVVSWEYDPEDDVALELGQDLTYELRHLLVTERPIAA